MVNGTGPAVPPGPTAPDALHGNSTSRPGTAALLERLAAVEAGGAISRLAADAGISTTTTRAFLIARGVQLRHTIGRPPREERPRAKDEDTTTVQIDPALEARIRERVAAGDARSVEDFMIQAVLLKFEVDRIPIDGKTTGDDPVDRYFDSPLGRERLRRVVQVALQTLPPGRKTVAEPGWAGSS